MAPAIVSAPAAGVKKAANNLPTSRAYVTFLAGNGDYWKGVVGLAKGLKKVKSAYPLVVAVLPDVPEDHRKILADHGCIVREIEPVYPPENQAQYRLSYYVINYSKLRMWEFVEYDKVVYLDGDVQVFGNIDELFDLPDGHVYGVVDCLCELTKKSCPEMVQWSKELGPKPDLYYNAGVIVFEPNISTYNALLSTLKVTPVTAFAEQDFLNMFFRDVYKPISPSYNMMVATMWRHPDLVDVENAKVVHYCAIGSKPWRFTGKEENMDREDMKALVKKWWEIYEDEDLDNEIKNTAGVVAEKGRESKENVTLKAALSEAGVIHYIASPAAA